MLLACLGSNPLLAADPPDPTADSTAQSESSTTQSGGQLQLPIDQVTVAPPSSNNSVTLPESIGSRLGLSQIETPATISVISPQTSQIRGFDLAEDAIDSATGVSSGGSPGDPDGYSIRGFTGTEITNLRDGFDQGPASMVYRPLNTFNLQSVQVLQGPASVLYGQGAVGGVTDTVTKEAHFGPSNAEFYGSYGSFNTATVGLGGGTQIGNDVAVRLDVSRTSSNGYIDNSNPASLNVTGSVLWRITPDLTLLSELDYLHDQLPSYYGTPLLPYADARSPIGGILSSSTGLTIDRDTLYNNYDVRDFSTKSTSFAPKTVLTWQLSPDVTLSNEVDFYYAQRRWQNAETYTYVTPGLDAVNAEGDPIPVGQVARDRFHVYHNQHEVTDRINLAAAGKIFGLENRISAGLQANYIRFIRNSGFPDAEFADSVDPYNVDQRLYGTFPGDYDLSRKSPTTIVDAAIFAEDVLSLTPKLKLVTGVRFDYFGLDRRNFSTAGVYNPTTSFSDTYFPDNYRAALLYTFTPRLSAYASYTTAQDPPDSNVFLANAGQITGLSGAEQEEIGAKAIVFNGRADATVALYDIHRSNILVSTGEETVANVGSQHSSGIELSGDAIFTSHWTANANAALTDAHYGAFQESATLNATGNEPPDIPRLSSNIETAYNHIANLPLDIGAGLRFIGNRYGDYANTLRLKEYTLFNVYAAYHLTPKVTLYGRIDNLFNRTYIQWVDVNYPGQVQIGEPRFFGVSLHADL